MRCIPGKCIKCEADIVEGYGPARNYLQDEYLLDNGNHLFVARCNKCTITPPEYGEVLAAVNAALAPHPISGEIVELLDTQDWLMIIRAAQGNRCRCGKDLGDTWVVNGDEILCGECGPYNFDRGQFEERTVLAEQRVQREGEGPPSAGKVARAHSQERRRKGANVRIRKSEIVEGGERVPEGAGERSSGSAAVADGGQSGAVRAEEGPRGGSDVDASGDDSAGSDRVDGSGD